MNAAMVFFSQIVRLGGKSAAAKVVPDGGKHCGLLKNAFRSFPAFHGKQAVRPNKKIIFRVRMGVSELLQRLAGIGIASAPDLDVGNLKMRVVGSGQLRHVQTDVRIQDPGLFLHIGTAAGNEQNLIQPEGGIGIFRQKQMADVDRIEGPAHDANPSDGIRHGLLGCCPFRWNLRKFIWEVQFSYAPCFPYTVRSSGRSPVQAGTGCALRAWNRVRSGRRSSFSALPP